MSKEFSKEAEGAAMERGVGGNGMLGTWDSWSSGKSKTDKTSTDVVR